MKYLYFESISSTNTFLKTNYSKLDDWTVLRVDYQSKGRGRVSHTWESEKGANLLCSILIKDKELFPYSESLPLLVGTVIRKTFIHFGLKDIQIKWPNDLYTHDKKIAGILLESKCEDKINALIIGTGINLNQTKFSEEINATSYYLLKKKRIDISDFLKMYIKFLRQEIKLLKLNKSKYIEVINKNNYLYGKKGYCILNNKKQLVTFLNVNLDNTLNIKLNNKVKKIASYEVTLLKK